MKLLYCQGPNLVFAQGSLISHNQPWMGWQTLTTFFLWSMPLLIAYLEIEIWAFVWMGRPIPWCYELIIQCHIACAGRHSSMQLEMKQILFSIYTYEIWEKKRKENDTGNYQRQVKNLTFLNSWEETREFLFTHTKANLIARHETWQKFDFPSPWEVLSFPARVPSRLCAQQFPSPSSPSAAGSSFLRACVCRSFPVLHPPQLLALAKARVGGISHVPWISKPQPSNLIPLPHSLFSFPINPNLYHQFQNLIHQFRFPFPILYLHNFIPSLSYPSHLASTRFDAIL